MRRYVVLALTLIILLTSSVAYGQQDILQCPDADTVRSFISALQTVLLLAVLAIILLVLFFNVFGFISVMLMRLAEFFNERIRFVFELLFIYIFFLWQLDPEMITEVGGCAQVDWQALLSNGPLFFRVVGWLLRLLGIAP